MCVHIYACLYVYIYIYIWLWANPRVQASLRAKPKRRVSGSCRRTYTCVYAYIYMCVYECIYGLTHMHKNLFVANRNVEWVKAVDVYIDI